MQANSALASVTMENKTICPDKSVEAVAVPKRRAHSTCWVRLEVLRFIMWRNTSVETYSSKRQDTFPTQRRSDITHDRSVLQRTPCTGRGELLARPGNSHGDGDEVYRGLRTLEVVCLAPELRSTATISNLAS